jgi:hypothetical protein
MKQDVKFLLEKTTYRNQSLNSNKNAKFKRWENQIFYIFRGNISAWENLSRNPLSIGQTRQEP